jgi:hypothetical protein
MRFNSRELGWKLTGPKCEGPSHCGGYSDKMGPCIDCTTPTIKGGLEKAPHPMGPCVDCTTPTIKGGLENPPHKPGYCKEDTRGPGKGKKKGGAHAAGLEMLRAQLRESLGGAAR